ncbi:hypothetical protein N9K72_01275 [Pontimonas sp.]|nr:hypothetical protein [Pontimonas sp.]
MSSRVLRLDPRLPLVWRTPNTLQIGIDPVVAIVEDVPDEALPLLEGLRAGVTRSGMAMLAAHAGLKEGQRDALLLQVHAALRTPPPATGLTLSVTGESAHRRLVADHLTLLGHTVSETSGPTSGKERIIMANYVLNPVEYRDCMSHDIPHTPVMFRDQSVTVGPRVTPGLGPCLQCLWRHELGINPHHQAVVSQLWNTAAPTDTAAMSLQATWAALTLIRGAQSGESIRIDAYSQQWSISTIEASLECLCRSLSVTPPA